MKSFLSSTSSFIKLNKKRKNDENINVNKQSKSSSSFSIKSSSIAPSSSNTQQPPPPLSSSSSSSSKVLSNKTNLKQMFLDLGQKSFGRSSLCQKCGMFYVIGDIDDEKSHLSYCNKYLEGPIISSMKGHKVLETINEGTDNESFIIEVKSDQKLNQDTISRVLNTVREELGSTIEYIKGNETIYFYVRGKLVIGCSIVEKIDSNTKLVRLSSEQTSADLMISNDDTISNKEISLLSEDTSQANHPIMGIRQIWVDQRFRKQKVANSLVDSARKNFLFGVIIPRDGIAFSQPTSDGQAFGLAYTGNGSNSKETIWAYA